MRRKCSPRLPCMPGSSPSWSICPSPARPGHRRPDSCPTPPLHAGDHPLQALGGLSCEGPGPHRSHARLCLTDRRESTKAALGSGRKKMGTLPKRSNCLPHLFQAFSALLGTRAPQAAWSPSSAPRGNIRMSLDRVSARPALLESEALGWPGLLLYPGDS